MLKLIRTMQLFVLFCLTTISSALAAGGGAAAPIVIVADTRFVSGIQHWWATLYNESHLYFTLLTIALIPTIGLIFGILADIIMKHIGINLSSRELSEH